jgi:Flp pilus assembly protein protease CpaA
MWVPFVFALCVLVYACVFDLKERQVSNKLWVFVCPTGFILTLVLVVFGFIGGWSVVVSVLSAVFLGGFLFWSGYYGGADLKALLFIALITPTLPFTLNSAFGLSALPVVLKVFCLSAIFSLIWPLSIFILNLKDLLKGKSMFKGINLSLRQKVLLLFTARLVPLAQLESLRYFPAETVVVVREEHNKPVRKLVHLVKAETNLQKYVADLKEHGELYRNGVLASPTIPTICFLTFALAILPLGYLLFGILL